MDFNGLSNLIGNINGIMNLMTEYKKKLLANMDFTKIDMTLLAIIFKIIL